jgi:hypothetical protein
MYWKESTMSKNTINILVYIVAPALFLIFLVLWATMELAQ